MVTTDAQSRLLDTSTLVAALYVGHEQHAWARAQLLQARRSGGCLSAHTLAELYKVLTGHPHIRMSPLEATRMLDELKSFLRVVPFTENSYHAALTRCAKHQLSGSVIFDALIAQAALEAEAAALLTLNPKDFRRLGEDVAGLVVSP